MVHYWWHCSMLIFAHNTVITMCNCWYYCSSVSMYVHCMLVSLALAAACPSGAGVSQPIELQRLYKLNDFLFDAGIDNLNLFKVSACYSMATALKHLKKSDCNGEWLYIWSEVVTCCHTDWMVVVTCRAVRDMQTMHLTGLSVTCILVILEVYHCLFQILTYCERSRISQKVRRTTSSTPTLNIAASYTASNIHTRLYQHLYDCLWCSEAFNNPLCCNLCALYWGLCVVP